MKRTNIRDYVENRQVATKGIEGNYPFPLQANVPLWLGCEVDNLAKAKGTSRAEVVRDILANYFGE